MTVRSTALQPAILLLRSHRMKHTRLTLLLAMLLSFSAAEDKTCGETTADGETSTEGECADLHDDCPNWARDGECDFNPKFMLKDCQKACRICMSGQDLQAELDYRLRIQQAGGDERYLETEHGISQTVFDGLDPVDAALVFRNMTRYMTAVASDIQYDSVRRKCRNRSRECLKWKLDGECDTNRFYMSTHCAPVCETCLWLDETYRCPAPVEPDDIWTEQGDLQSMFDRIVEDYGTTATVHLQPPAGSWIISLDDFLTDAECDELIRQGEDKGYKLSTSLRQGIPGQEYVNAKRTSMNTWCDTSGCREACTSVFVKMEELTKIPKGNYENLQLLRYEPNQHCFVHNDFLDHHVDQPQGARILTLLLYLSDVAGGGETYFDSLGVSVTPRKGRAVLWPSVLDDGKFREEDVSTNHGSHAVAAGNVKYAANAFIHQRDTSFGYERGCF